MRKEIHLLACLSLVVMFLVGCKASVYTSQSSHEDIAYMQFVSSTKLSGDYVQVILDGGTEFQAKVNKEKKAYNRPDRYTIQPGKRSVRVMYKGRVIYDSDIYVSQQSTKIIRL